MAPTKAVHARGFTFTYAGQSSPVLANVAMDVPEGAFAVVCGSTGSGKTTLLRSMTEALAPAGERSGIMEVFGSESPEPTVVGFVMQDPESQIVCDTVLRELAFGLENLGVPPDAMRRRVAEVATVLGVDRLVDRRTAELSGGQKQLVNLAAALAMRPRLLLLDEPTARLDPVSARQLCDTLRVANGQLGLTVLVATHAPELFADMASCAFELSAGSVHEIALDALRFEPEGEPAYASLVVANEAETRPHGAHEEVPQGSEQKIRKAKRGLCGKHGEAPIRLHDAWFAYDRESPWVLKGLSAGFRQGAVTCIVGGNGCGKTTLLKAIAGILRPQRGKVRNELGFSQAYLPQDPRLLLTADTVAEELAMSQSARHFDSLFGERVKVPGTLTHTSPLDLSGGQQQMLALAKLLAANPRLLLLDEPVKGLDAEAQMQLATLLRQVACEGTTVIMVTHDLSFASRVADTIALMFDGQIASCASPAEFFADAAYCKPRPNAFTIAWDKVHAAHAAHATEEGGPMPDAEPYG